MEIITLDQSKQIILSQSLTIYETKHELLTAEHANFCLSAEIFRLKDQLFRKNQALSIKSKEIKELSVKVVALDKQNQEFKVEKLGGIK